MIYEVDVSRCFTSMGGWIIYGARLHQRVLKEFLICRRFYRGFVISTTSD